MENLTPNTNKWNKYLTGVAIALMTIITTYLVHTNSVLNLADLTNTGIPAAANQLYMPNYTSGVGETGLIEIKSNSNIANFDSITFSLKYTPVNALIFEKNPIVFDAGTEFQDAAFQMTASPEDGKLIVTIILNDPIAITAGDTLFKLNTQVNPDLAKGQVINVTFEDVALLNGSDPLVALDMPASTITLTGKDTLKVLNAQSIDSTHVLVEFSDLLSNVGSTVDYDVCKDGNFDGVSACDPGSDLAVSLVEPGTNYGYSQKFVVLTTAAQTAGQTYTITTEPTLATISSNQQGGVDSDFSNVIFHGFGPDADVLSDFGMVSASVSGYEAVTVTFTDAVQAASVTKTDFSLSIQGGAPIAITNVTSVSGKDVTLTVAVPLLKEKTYLLSTVSTDSVLRDSDGASLGMDAVTFSGSKNGPRLIGSTVTNNNGVYSLQLTFDENIQLPAVPIANNPVGHLHTTGVAAGTLIDDTNPAYVRTISNATLTITNPVFNAPNTNFTFAVSAPGWLTNSLGVPVEDTYKSISFWGFGHDNSLNTIGVPTIMKKDAFRIPAGTLDFSALNAAKVTVLYNNGTANLVAQAVNSIGLTGSDLDVVMSAPLDPDRHYVVRIVDNANNTLAAKDFAVVRSLNIASVQAVSSTDVRVFFSDTLDERNIDATDFKVDDDPVVSMTMDPGHQSVLLKTAGPFTAGTIYKVSVSGLSDVYSHGGNAMLLYVMYFTGYLTQAAQSAITIQSVQAIDAKKIRMTFTGALDQTTFTPVNLSVFNFSNPLDPTIHDALTVTGVTKIDNTTYDVATSIQHPGKNYFTVFNGVKDSLGLKIGNHKIFNFLGFELPKAAINLVTPNKTTNDLDTNVVLSGNNLDLVKEVRLGNKAMTIVSQSKISLTFTVPKDFVAQLYDITLIDQADNSMVSKNAILVTIPDQPLIVHSEQSQSIPLNVPNDGTTKTKLWLLVEDPLGLSSISSVVVNLSQIGGPSTAEMTKDTGTQPQFSQWYTYETAVPATVQTKDAPYLLPVEVRKGSEKFAGTLSIRVTKDVVKSVAPKIDQIYISPVSVPPDGTTPVKISAQITDQDGAATISSVVADLGSLGIGFKPLKAMSDMTAGTELETQFFSSEDFTVPKTTQLGTYSINIIASDVTGEKTSGILQLQVSTSATGPKIDKDMSYISPRKSIPRDGKTTFSVNAYVSDPDGLADIQTVTANFSSIGLAPISLKKDAEAAADGKGAWYQATNLTIPKTAPLGMHDIDITATDKAGGISNLILQIEVTFKDTLGDPPRVVDDRSYTTPRTAINDGQTPVTLYTFVQDDNDDIQSVIVNLSEIGQVGTQNNGTLGSSGAAVSPDASKPGDGGCPTGSNVLVCMNPSVKEGVSGQWFILPGVMVNPLTTPSPDPYSVEVMVTDSGGKTATGVIKVYVGNAASASDQQEPPKASAAIPTSETTIEVLFNKEISATSLAASGKDFTISSDSNINEELSIVGATINPAGNVVTLSTENQLEGKQYVLSVSKNIKDITGRGVIEGSANRLNFTGFKGLKKPPVVEYIQASDVNMVELEFQNNLKPSSVHSGVSQADGSSQFGISIYEEGNSSKRLDVLGVSLLGPGNVLHIKTGPQKPEQKYRINLEGLASYDGTSITSPLNKGFKGYNLTIAEHKAAAGYADLNGDGRVDFTDFTIFSSVYGTIYSGQGNNLAQSAAKAAQQAAAAQAQVGQPLTPNPNATVPSTSIPQS